MGLLYLYLFTFYIKEGNRQCMAHDGNYVFRIERLVLLRGITHGTLCIFKNRNRH